MVAIWRWVSITPLGMPVVPEEYGRAATSSAGSMSICGSGAVGAQHVDQRAVPGRAVADEDLPYAAREFGGPCGPSPGAVRR